MQKTQPLCTTAKLNFGDRVLGDAEKNNYCFARRMGILQAHFLKTVCPYPGGSAEELYSNSGVANKD